MPKRVVVSKQAAPKPSKKKTAPKRKASRKKATAPRKKTTARKKPAKTAKKKTKKTAALATRPTPLVPPRQDASLDRQREAKRAWAASQSRGGRDIGPIAPIANLERRAACRHDLKLFCETYNSAAIYHAWSDDHLKAIARLQEAILLGALYAFAMPRGSGKTTLCRMAMLFAVANALCRYPYLIGANADKATESLDAIKTMIRFLPDFVADYPEICQAINALDGIANRASGQLCRGESTMIYWGQKRVVLPTVPPPPNWPDDWPRDIHGYAPTSGSVIGVAGLTGDGIRGSLHTAPTGEQIRPDLVLLDDPQTDESAASMAGNAKRERLIAGAVLGMAGPGRSIAAVMPCTVIQPGDMVDRILDREKHPLWRGERTRMMRAMPTNMGAWEKYFEVYRRCALREPPDYAEANAWYREHRAILDEGAEAAWPQRKLDTEISAIQHAMHLYARDEMAFWAEYQNEPKANALNSEFLASDQIAAKVIGIEHGEPPADTQCVTAFIDVQQRCLYFAVIAWSEGFSGAIIDYGTFPEQQRHYFQYGEITRTLSRKFQGAGDAGAIHAGLMALFAQLCGRQWGDLSVTRLLVDAGDGNYKNVIYQACRDSPHRAVILPSFGRGLKAGDRPMEEWKKSPGEKVGHEWRIRHAAKEKIQYVLFDTNHWKTFMQQRLATAVGDPGSLSLYRATPAHHRMIADQLTAERGQRTEGRGRQLIEWKLPPNRPDNHLLDCVVGATVAASISGVGMLGHEPAKKRGKKRRRATGAWAR